MGLNAQLAHNRRFRLCCGLTLASIALLTLFYNPFGKPLPNTPSRFGFQKDEEIVEQPQDELQAPAFKLSQDRIHLLKHYNAHNFPNVNGHTFATLLCTRDPSADDIYLLATRVLIYHFLWRSQSKSPDKPITIFVAPFVPQWKRDILMAEGAHVIEIPVIEIAPKVTNWNSERWRDQFTKLNMWNETQFSKIAYFDSDAFPLHHVDPLFDLTPTQRCNPDLLDEHDRPHVDEICDYVFAGVPILNKPEVGPNGGLLVFTPEERMHDRLVRLAPQTDRYNSELLEQGMFEWVYGYQSPFPARQLPRKWNGLFPGADEEAYLQVVHEKIWNKDYNEHGLQWMTKIWDESWAEMKDFYNSEEFLQIRKRDGLRRS